MSGFFDRLGAWLLLVLFIAAVVYGIGGLQAILDSHGPWAS